MPDKQGVYEMNGIKACMLTSLLLACLASIQLIRQRSPNKNTDTTCRHALKESFPDKLWLDIISKSDLLTAHPQAADALMHHSAGTQTSVNTPAAAAQSYESDLNESRRQSAHQQPHDSSNSASDQDNSHASHVDGANRNSASQQAESVQQTAASVSGSDLAATMAEEQDGWGGVINSAESMTVAVQAAAMFPHALRISSVTQDGIQSLQLAVMHLLSNENLEIVNQQS